MSISGIMLGKLPLEPLSAVKAQERTNPRDRVVQQRHALSCQRAVAAGQSTGDQGEDWVRRSTARSCNRYRRRGEPMPRRNLLLLSALAILPPENTKSYCEPNSC